MSLSGDKGVAQFKKRVKMEHPNVYNTFDLAILEERRMGRGFLGVCAKVKVVSSLFPCFNYVSV